MSNKITVDNQVDDQEFLAFAQGIKKQREDQANKFQSGSGGGYTYEQPKWASLESDTMRIFRIVSSPPPPYSVAPTNRAVELHVSDIQDDNGKFFRLRLPVREDRLEKDHVLWRMISKITETVWEDKKRVSKWATKYPELYDRIMKGGWASTSAQYKFSRGWAGQKVVVFNVIDREDMAWHKENKHTKLLSKQVNYTTSDDGETREWPSIGVPSFGFIDELGRVSADYGSLKKYDIGIVKTGQKTSPYRIVNASAFVQGGLKEVPEALKGFVSLSDSLTEEELSWEIYDLEKLYGPITYTSTLRHFDKSLKEFDAAFNTDYYDEVKDKAAQEAKLREAAKAAASGDEAPAPQRATRSTAEKSERAVEYIPVDQKKIDMLKGFNKLTKEQQLMITDVEIDGDKVKRITFNEEAGATVGCPDCNVASPTTFSVCPVCAVEFE